VVDWLQNLSSTFPLEQKTDMQPGMIVRQNPLASKFSSIFWGFYRKNLQIPQKF